MYIALEINTKAGNIIFNGLIWNPYIFSFLKNFNDNNNTGKILLLYPFCQLLFMSTKHQKFYWLKACDSWNVTGHTLSWHSYVTARVSANHDVSCAQSLLLHCRTCALLYLCFTRTKNVSIHCRRSANIHCYCIRPPERNLCHYFRHT